MFKEEHVRVLPHNTMRQHTDTTHICDLNEPYTPLTLPAKAGG